VKNSIITGKWFGPLWLAWLDRSNPGRRKVVFSRPGWTTDTGGGGVFYKLQAWRLQIAIQRTLSPVGRPTKKYPGALFLHFKDARSALQDIAAQDCTCPRRPVMCPHKVAQRALDNLGTFTLKD
jgi:hypothetical protein